MVSTHKQGISAREAGLKACTSCAALQAIADESPCRRCGATVRSRRDKSLQRVWAFLIVGVMAYVPANIYPIMLTRSFTGNTSDTILSGVFVLMQWWKLRCSAYHLRSQYLYPDRQVRHHCGPGAEPAFRLGLVQAYAASPADADRIHWPMVDD